MIRVLMFIAALLLPCAVRAGDDRPLSVEQVVQISQALSQLNCGSRIIRDGAKETLVCENYKWSTGLIWLIASNQRKAQEIATQYVRLRNQAVAALAHKPDGNPTDDALAKFAVQDREMLDGNANITLERFRRSDLEPMNLPPSVISALMPIID